MTTDIAFGTREFLQVFMKWNLQAYSEDYFSGDEATVGVVLLVDQNYGDNCDREIASSSDLINKAIETVEDTNARQQSISIGSCIPEYDCHVLLTKLACKSCEANNIVMALFRRSKLCV